MAELIFSYLTDLVGIFTHLIFLRMIFDLFRNLIFDTNKSARG